MGECIFSFMINFQKLELVHIPLLKAYFSHVTTRLCDTTLGGAVMWRNGFETDFALVDDILFLRSRPDEKSAAFTVPLGDFQRGVRLLQEHCKETGEPLRFCSVAEEVRITFWNCFPALRRQQAVIGLTISTKLKSFLPWPEKSLPDRETTAISF